MLKGKMTCRIVCTDQQMWASIHQMRRNTKLLLQIISPLANYGRFNEFNPIE